MEKTTSLFMETAGFAPPITGEEICVSLRMVAQHVEAIIPKGRNAWEVVLRSGDVATGLEVTGIVLRGRSIELSQRFPGGTWVRVRGITSRRWRPHRAVHLPELRGGGVGPPPRHVEGHNHKDGGSDPEGEAHQGDPPEFFHPGWEVQGHGQIP